MKYYLVILLSFFYINFANSQNKNHLELINNELAKSISYLNLKYKNSIEIKNQRIIIPFEIQTNKDAEYFVIYKIKYSYEGRRLFEYFAKYFRITNNNDIDPSNSVILIYDKIKNSTINKFSKKKNIFTVTISKDGNTNRFVFDYNIRQSWLSGKWNNKIELPVMLDNWSWSLFHKIGSVVKVGYFEYQVNSIQFTKDINSPIQNLYTNSYFLLISISITNIDKESRSIFNSMFTLEDDSGYKYEVSHEANAALAIQNKDVIIFETLSPRIKKNYIISFEVPTEIAFYTLNVSGGFTTNEQSIILLVKE